MSILVAFVLVNIFGFSELLPGHCPRRPRYDIQILHQWAALGYKIPGPALHHANFIPENNYLFSMDVFEENIFVNVMRGSWENNFRDGSGVPSTLNRVITLDGMSLLEPYPSLVKQKVGNCKALQNVGAIRVDKTTGILWVVDYGMVNKDPVCKAKIVLINTRTRRIIKTYIFPETVFNQFSGSIADITFVAGKNGVTRYALMPDFRAYKMIVYDRITDRSWFFEDRSMRIDTCGTRFAAGTRVFNANPGIRNIMVLPTAPGSREYVYYNTLAGSNLYQVPLDIVKLPNGKFSKNVRVVGEFPAQTHSIIPGRKAVYFSDTTRHALKKWNIKDDLRYTNYDQSKVMLESIETLVFNADSMPYVTSLSLDGGYLYYLSTNLAEQRLGTIRFDDPCNPNFIIGRIFVNDTTPFLRPLARGPRPLARGRL